MKKRCLAALIALTLFPASLVAQEDEPKTQFVTMEEMDIEAARTKAFESFRTNNPAQFDRLVRLKKSFLKNVRESADANSLN